MLYLYKDILARKRSIKFLNWIDLQQVTESYVHPKEISRSFVTALDLEYNYYFRCLKCIPYH